MNDGFEVEKRAFKQLVDYNEVEFAGLCHLVGGILQPQFDHLRRVLAAALQPGAQLFPARRQDEDQHGIGEDAA